MQQRILRFDSLCTHKVVGKVAQMAFSLFQLIRHRMQNLGITRGELARRMGYANVAKGCRRMDQICARDVRIAGNRRVELARGLDVDAEVIDEYIEFTPPNRLPRKTRPIAGPSGLTRLS